MQFQKEDLYHIYNQGNNRQKIFFRRDNYLFFMEKIKTYVSPYADILAWCLMTNHFHLMVKIRNVELTTSECYNLDSNKLSKSKTRTLNDSIAILLRSYTRAINKQEKRSGSLFRSRTKAECLTSIENIAPSFYNTNSGFNTNNLTPNNQHPENCFHYIHLNPVKANLVKKATDWEFSSAQHYANLRDDRLTNRDVAKQHIINLNEE